MVLSICTATCQLEHLPLTDTEHHPRVSTKVDLNAVYEDGLGGICQTKSRVITKVLCILHITICVCVCVSGDPQQQDKCHALVLIMWTDWRLQETILTRIFNLNTRSPISVYTFKDLGPRHLLLRCRLQAGPPSIATFLSCRRACSGRLGAPAAQTW